MIESKLDIAISNHPSINRCTDAKLLFHSMMSKKTGGLVRQSVLFPLLCDIGAKMQQASLKCYLAIQALDW